MTLLISSPPFLNPCIYGINTPTREELIGSRMSVEEIRAHIEADRLGYLSMDGLLQAMHTGAGKFCDACFTGKYPHTA